MFKSFIRASSAVALNMVDVWLEKVGGTWILFIYLEQSKNDQFRHGHTVLLGPGQDWRFCPLVWYFAFLKFRDPRAIPLLHKANNAPDKLTKHLRSSTINAQFKKRNKKAGILTHLTSQCLRAGGVTTALAKGVQMRVAKRHGNWKSDAVYVYITESLESQLSVSMCT
jgi:hypothetical protein